MEIVQREVHLSGVKTSKAVLKSIHRQIGRWLIKAPVSPKKSQGVNSREEEPIFYQVDLEYVAPRSILASISVQVGNQFFRGVEFGKSITKSIESCLHHMRVMRTI